MDSVRPFHRAQALESVLQMATFAMEQGRKLGIVTGRTVLEAHMQAVREMLAEEMPDYREWLADMAQAEVAQERHEIDHEPLCTGFDYVSDVYCRNSPQAGSSLCAQCTDGPGEP